MSFSQFKLIRRVHATGPISEVKLIYAILKSKFNNINFKLDLTVEIDSVKYRLIDFESLIVASPHFESSLQKYLPLKEGDVFIDAGAHIGKYSLSNAKIVGNKGKIVAIEADPDTFQALEIGIAENLFTNVIPLNCAAYNKDCQITFYSAPLGGVDEKKRTRGKGFSSTKYQQGRNKTHVTAKKIDTIVSELDLKKVDYIKIDTEGAEVEVLEGAKNTIRHFQPKLLIESMDTQREVKLFLGDVGYIMEKVSESYFYGQPL